MKPKQLIKHFGSHAKAAKAIGVTRVTVYTWEKAGRVPHLWALWIDYLTEGVLEFRERDYKDVFERLGR